MSNDEPVDLEFERARRDLPNGQPGTFATLTKLVADDIKRDGLNLTRVVVMALHEAPDGRLQPKAWSLNLTPLEEQGMYAFFAQHFADQWQSR